jgi:circadian clock protein KaiC
MTRSREEKLELESAGDPALDKILGGGIPRRSIIVIAGEPGSGKTVLTLQMLFAAARRGRKCLYFTTLSEPAMKVIRYMQLFDFFSPELMDKTVIFSDLGAAIRQGPEATLAQIEKSVEQHEPGFIAIDSFRVIGEMLRGQEVMRSFVYDLAVRMATWGATTLLVGEYAREEFPLFAEFAIADGIMHVGSERQALTSVREIEILKLRGGNYASGQHYFDIDRRGVSFFPRVSAPSDVQQQPSARADDRVTTGITGLDELLGGGLPRGSATMVQGGTGTGKTLLCLQFLLEGAARGEKGVLFTLEETPDQLRSIARSIGWDLRQLEKRDLLAIRYTSPVELSTDRFLYQAMNEAKQGRAARAVFDSLTTMALGVPNDRRFKELVYAIAKHMHGEDISLLMTVESEQLLGSARPSGQNVSFIADVLIRMRYVEIAGRLERAISVLKARGIQHNSELRAFTIGQGGLQVHPSRFKDTRGVLTGLPEGEARTRDG